jgi:hypothetical protein
MTTGCSTPASKTIMPKPSASPSTSSKPAQNEQARQDALAAYTGMWTTMGNDSHTANYTDNALSWYATDSALSKVVGGLYNDHLSGTIARGMPTMHPVVTSLVPASDPTSATIKDCGDDSAWIQVVAATGAPKDKTPGGRRLIQAKVVKADNLWRVADFVVNHVGTC